MNLREFIEDKHVDAIINRDIIEKVCKRVAVFGGNIGSVLGAGFVVPWVTYLIFIYVCLAVFSIGVVGIWLFPAIGIWQRVYDVFDLGVLRWNKWDIIATGFLVLVFLQFFNFLRGTYYSMAERGVVLRFVVIGFLRLWVLVCVGLIFWWGSPFIWVLEHGSVEYILANSPIVLIGAFWAYKLVRLKGDGAIIMFERSFDKGYNYLTEKI